MNWQLLIPLLITTGLAICGWFIGHALTVRRDRMNKRRDQRIAYLIEAYRTLESCANRGNALEGDRVESAVADIQLFGSAKQVELVQAFVAEYAQGKGANLNGLLQDLRRDLRNELQLENVPSKLLHIRFSSNGASDVGANLKVNLLPPRE